MPNLLIQNPRREPILVVNEIFGPTIQGEGKSIGTPTMFLRLAGCNLACVWCDTKYSWDWQHYDPRREMHPMNMDEVCRAILPSPIKHLVISGGEPLLQNRVLAHFTAILHSHGWYTEIETAGTIIPQSTEMAKQFNVSPKLLHSGNPDYKRYKPEVLDIFAMSNRANFKFVVQDSSDWSEIDELVSCHKLHPVYIMPEGTDTETLDGRMETIVKGAIERGYNISPRLHIQLYGKRRGI